MSSKKEIRPDAEAFSAQVEKNIEESLFRAGAHAHMDPEHDALNLFFCWEEGEKNAPSVQSISLALKMRRLLNHNLDCSTSGDVAATPHTPVFSLWPRNIRQYKNVSFNFMLNLM